MSLLPQVTLAHILSIQNDEAKRLPEFFNKQMLARMKVENPYYEVLVRGIAEIATKEFRVKDKFTPTDMEELVTQVGMYCFRALELAANDAEQSKVVKEFTATLMSDPNTQSLEFDSMSALTESRLLFKRLAHNPSMKKRE